MRSFLLPLVLLAACKGSGTLTLDDSGNTTGDDTNSTSDDTGPTGDDSPVDTGNPAEGVYSLLVTFTDPERGFTICEGTAEVSVAEDGALTGTGSCTFEEGPGAGSSADLSFEAAADAAGVLTGTATTSMTIMGQAFSVDAELSGQVTPPELQMAWTVEMGGGGPNGGGPSFSAEAHTSP